MRFAQDVLGLSDESVVWSKNRAYFGHAWDGTEDPIKKVATTLHRACFHDTGLSGIVIDHACGVGASSMLAWLGMWFAQAFGGARVFTVAPKESQLRAQVWHYIEQCFPAMNEAARGRATFSKDHLLLNIRGSSIEAICEDYTDSRYLSAMHFEYLLVLVDSAQGMSKAWMDALQNMCVGRKNFIIAAGTPSSDQCAYHKLADRSGFERVRISALDHPNVVTGEDVIPGAVNRRFVRNAYKKAEDDALHPTVLSRVRGMAPPTAVAPDFAAWG